ncbi:PREDICTED: EH domain-binding protein 1 [Papilio polytes]|uniref:EH domain-binding protein 1 n=1 Tax=Papilio polytes TaxID=76194 RepID=UPI00067682CD|nr:PREDICTED: EH domain-binding protein 1 [Papilio polytes]
MASVWKRLQRVNKRAAKFQYTASYHRIDVETTPKWKPNKLSIVWTRRSRRVVTEPVEWEPSLKDPLNLHLTLHSVLLREGHATDEDMQSLASLLSVNNNSDIAVLEDLDEDDYTLSDNSTRQMLDLRQQMEEMTQSLTNSDIAATPNSVQSLNFDNSATPTAPITPTTDTPTNPATPTSPTTPTNNKEIDFTPKDINIKRPEYNNFTKLSIKTESPKFTSTPKAEEPIVDNFKALQFKPKTIAKKNLKPLELKTNLNNISLDTNENEKGDDSEKTPVVDMEKLFPLKGLDKDKTPVQDLLEWCQGVTREYRVCRITNLTTSFRSGLAFCAIIHRFRPDLIDFSGLQPEEAERNLRVALEASARLGISQVLTAADVCAPPAPDKLAIMTYLFQLRAHFTGSELQVEQLGNDETESSYLVGRHDTDGSVPTDLFSREVSERRSRMRARPRPRSQDSDSKSQERASPEKISPAPMKEVRDLLVQQSKTILGKMLSPARDLKPRESNTKWFTDPPPPEPIPARPEKLMTRKELTDPFGSDEEEEPAPPAQDTVTDTVKVESKPIVEAAVTDPLTSLHEATPPQTTPQEEQTPVPDLPKPTPVSITLDILYVWRFLCRFERVVEGIGESESRRSPLQSFTALVDRLAPDEGNESGSYIASELEALEREQGAVDERAAALEKQLRRVMESADNTEEEDRLMSQWFHLVNKKNALLRRQMQLNILEQEEDLSRRCELLARELRLSLAVDEWRKTPGQKRRERLLLQELLSAVNERDRLVQEMDEQEKAIAEDDEIERNLSNVEIQRKNNCILQ